MHRHLRINLEDHPWPVNILKFNQAVHDMRPGDDMLAIIKDANVVGNLQQLLSSLSGLRFNVSVTNTDFRIRITKG